MGLGDLYYKETRFGEALDYWNRLLEIEPDLINILTMCGNICRRLHQFPDAVGYFKRALDICPDNSYAVYGMADALRGCRRHQEAAPFWRRICELDAGNHKVMTRAGDCCLVLGDPDTAEQLYRKALAIAPDRYAEIGLCRILSARGRLEETIHNARALLAGDPGDLRLILFLAKTIEEHEDRGAAIDFISGCLAGRPDDTRIRSLLNEFSRPESL
jgi:tetratricopeptide (TPR) repeat protein